MAKVGIVTDGTNCLPLELIREYDIRVAPMGMVMGDKFYRDTIDITTSEFWKIFRTLPKLPTTTGAVMEELANRFRELSKTTDTIACILVSADLSAASHQAALNAKDIVKKEVPGLNIEIVDSRTTLGAMGFIVLEAAKAAKDGKDLSQIIEVVKGMTPRVHWMAMLETLRYLIKGGRAPKVGGWIGEMLDVKPIIGMSGDSGVIQALGRARTRTKAMPRLVELAKESLGGKKPVHMLVHYGEIIEDGEKLKEMVSSQLDCAELYLTELTPVMCTHTGPMIGLSFYA